MSQHYPMQAVQAMHPMQSMQPMGAYAQAYPMQQPWGDVGFLLSAAGTGAAVAATGAAAVNLHHVRNDAITWQEAAGNTLQAGLTAGLATAAGAAVGRMFARYPLASLAATLVTSTAVMYVLTDRQTEAADE